MKGYWQRHIEKISANPNLLEIIDGGGHDDDAVALAREIAADAGRMSREDI